MKIGFDASDLCTRRADGTTRYTRELLKHLPAMAAAHDWTLFSPCELKEKAAPAGRQVNVTSMASPWPGWWTQSRLPLELWRATPEVLFMPIQQLPYLRPGRTKTVAVVHDLAVHRYPEQFRYKDWLLLHTFSAYAAREADQLIAVSQATADDLARYYGREKRVRVVHHGVDHDRFYAPGEEEARAGWQRLSKRFSALHQPYVLYVGQIQPRKNLVRLIAAFERVKEHLPGLQLVLAGGHGWRQASIHQALARSPVASDIVSLGVIPDDLLAALYWHAEVFVLPSLYEGFGMPILEAFACGCPVVCADVSSMPEVAGGAAVLVDPLNTESIAGGITEALGTKTVLRERGIARALEFTWEKTAKETLEVILAAAHEA
jgi:glycosyltransferase involved in cell wall biosynthesis